MATSIFIKLTVATCFAAVGLCLHSRESEAGPVAAVALGLGIFGLCVL
jgi:hypothetical protein